MSSRTMQAFNLGRTLSDGTGVEVRLVYDSGARWCVEWTNGATAEQMRERVELALVSGRYPNMRDRKLSYYRGETARAWAARAIAARRDGSLAREATTYPRHRPSSCTPGSTLTPEDYATLAVVEQLVYSTPYPDRASVSEDEPLIEQLLATGKHNEVRMARILTNAGRTPKSTRTG